VLSRSAGEALVACWQRWDEHPASEASANAMESACQQLAAHLGWPASRLRDALAAGRSSGLSYSAALRAAASLRRPHDASGGSA
jgi:hypothetical protein